MVNYGLTWLKCQQRFRLVVAREFTKLFQQQQHELETTLNILVFWCKTDGLLYGLNH